jgi:hypothetical protein
MLVRAVRRTSAQAQSAEQASGWHKSPGPMTKRAIARSNHLAAGHSRRDDDGAARSGDATPHDRSAMLALIDELASLAADLWFVGKLDRFPLEEQPVDDD